MIVCKFGGSSVASIIGAKNIKNIISKNNNRSFVVVSALGKSDVFAKKVTDELCECFLCCKTDKNLAEEKLSLIIDKYIFLANELEIKIDFSKEKNKIIEKIENNTITKEFLVSRGEYFSALLYAKFLNAIFLDAKDYIIFNKNGKLNFKATKQKLCKLNKKQKYVMGGFYGVTKNGQIVTFPRGGSDITGAIVAKALNAEIYENYTDVNGVYNKNPNLFDGAQNMPILNYKTACQMADCGNEVVHKSALFLLKDTNTILVVKNTNNYEGFGTVVIDTVKPFNNIFICVNKQKMMVLKDLNATIFSQLKHLSDVKDVLFLNSKYYVFFNDVHVDDNTMLNYFKPDLFVNVCKFCIFCNVKMCPKDVKNIKKIQKILKKYAFFAKFLSFANNFVIVCEKENEQKIISILNKHLQK